MNTQEKNAKPVKPEEAKPVKRVLATVMLRHLPGMAVQTGVKAGAQLPAPQNKQTTTTNYPNYQQTTTTYGVVA